MRTLTYRVDGEPQQAGGRTVTLTAADALGDGSPASFTLTVVAVNDPPVAGVPAGQSVAEDGTLTFSAAGGNAISVSDSDAATVRVTLSAGDGVINLAGTAGLSSVFGDGTAGVAIEGSIAAVNAALDGMSYSPSADFNGPDFLAVTVEDLGGTGDGGPQSDTATVAITVTPQADPPALTVTAVAVPENAPAGTTAATASVIDPDAGDSATYSLDDDAGGRFTIDAATGEVTTTRPLDRETAAARAITVRVVDGDGLADVQTVTITVGDVNEAPVLTVGPLSVPENAAAGAVVGTAAANDADAGDGVTFSLDDDAGGLFAIDAVTGEVTTTRPTDFEAAPSHPITVRATDAAGLSDTAAVVVTVQDVNETPTLTVGPLTVAENAAAGTVVGSAAAGDVDTGDALTFSLDEDASGLFVVDAVTGEITATQPLDHEAAAVHTVVVRATDAAGLSDVVSADVAVADRNEGPVLTVGVLTVPENAAAGTTAGFAAAADPDAGQGVTYSLTDDAGGRFAVDAATGEITSTGPFDFETGPAYSVTVTATDPLGLSTSATADVSVLDVTEAPAVVSQTLPTTPEDTPVTLALASAAFLDPDAGAELTVDLTAEGGTLSRTRLNGTPTELAAAFAAVTFTPDADFAGTARLLASVTDETGLASAGAFTIPVSPVNDRPTATPTGTVHDAGVGREVRLSAADLIAELGDVDTPPGQLFLTVVAGPSSGSLIPDGGGFVYRPAGGFVGADAFTVAVSDGLSLSDPVTVSLSVEGPGRAVAPGTQGPDGSPFEASEESTDDSPDEEAIDGPDVAPEESMPPPDAIQSTVTTTTTQTRTTSTADVSAEDSSTDSPPSAAAAAVTAVGGPLVTAGESIIDFAASGTFLLGAAEGGDAVASREASARNRDGGRGADSPGPFDAADTTAESSFASATLAAGAELIGHVFEGIEDVGTAAEAAAQARLTAGAAVVAGASLTVGYAVWIVRSGYLVTSLIGTVPTWRNFDPILLIRDFEQIRSAERVADQNLGSMLNRT